MRPPSGVWRYALRHGLSGRLRRLQNGYARSYAVSMFGGAALIVAAAVARDDANVASALEEVSRIAGYLKVLASYPAAVL